MTFAIHLPQRLRSTGLCSFAAALGLALLTGCEPKTEAGKDLLDRADQKAKGDDFSAAIVDYEKALGDPANAPEVHYRLALIYDDKLKDPLDALHHLQRYLALAPEGPHGKEVRRLIADNESKLHVSLSDGGTIPQKEAARLKNENLDLRKQISELRVRASQTPPPHAVAGEQVQRPIPPGARTYVVEPGDTLAAISRKFFKTAARWKDIQDANFYSLNGTAKLKPGMKLIIPQ